MCVNNFDKYGMADKHVRVSKLEKKQYDSGKLILY